jgi:hypothetical protein
MIPPFEAAAEFHGFLTSHNISYAVIGAIAVQVWGEPRATQDLDLTIAVPIEHTEAALETLLRRFQSRIPDAASFARAKRILLLRASNGVPVDVSLALPGYEDEVMTRASVIALAPGMEVRVCSPEDLVIHKCVAGRANDLRDVEGIVARQRARLDVSYIRRWLGFFSEVLAAPDPVSYFETAWRKASPSAP